MLPVKGDRNMSTKDPIVDKEWADLTYAQKNHELFLKQKRTLDMLLEHGAITQAQHDKSLHDLTEKMGETK